MSEFFKEKIVDKNINVLLCELISPWLSRDEFFNFMSALFGTGYDIEQNKSILFSWLSKGGVTNPSERASLPNIRIGLEARLLNEPSLMINEIVQHPLLTDGVKSALLEHVFGRIDVSPLFEDIFLKKLRMTNLSLIRLSPRILKAFTNNYNNNNTIQLSSLYAAYIHYSDIIIVGSSTWIPLARINIKKSVGISVSLCWPHIENLLKQWYNNGLFE